LIGAGIIIFGFTGSWRSVVKLRDGVAMGKADARARTLLRRLRIYRVLSLAFAAATVAAYLFSRPFRSGFWVIAVVWLLSVTPLLNEARGFIEKWESKR
jgi:hypothetical protein